LPIFRWKIDINRLTLCENADERTRRRNLGSKITCEAMPGSDLDVAGAALVIVNEN